MLRYLIILPVIFIPVEKSRADQLACQEFMKNQLAQICRRPKENYLQQWESRNPDATPKQRYDFMMGIINGWRSCQIKELEKKGYAYSSYYPIECASP